MTDELKEAIEGIDEYLEDMPSLYAAFGTVKAALISSQRGAPRPYTQRDVDLLQRLATLDWLSATDAGGLVRDLANRLSAGLKEEK